MRRSSVRFRQAALPNSPISWPLWFAGGDLGRVLEAKLPRPLAERVVRLPRQRALHVLPDAEQFRLRCAPRRHAPNFPFRTERVEIKRTMGVSAPVTKEATCAMTATLPPSPSSPM